MRSLIVAVLLASPAAAWAAQDQNPTPEPAAPAAATAPAEPQAAQPAAPAATEPKEGPKRDEAKAAKKPKGPHAAGLDLGAGIRLNGRFDVAYERYGFSSNLDEGKNDIKNYHHFVFLTREKLDDPFFITAELIERYFYEFGFKRKPKALPISYTVRAGKILVPFGGDPLFHHQYGGLSGFDQPVLPAVFSQLGSSINVQYRVMGVGLSNDMYAVQGYALSASNAVLNLQSDFSKSENLHAAFGDRLSASYGPVSVWYSILFNTLGYEQQVVMQALDAELYRLADIPVVENFVLAAGILRADITGAGRGSEYYHFADYVSLKYFFTDWLSAEARTGLRTSDNRIASYIDKHALTKDDASAHNLTVTYRRDGFLLAAQQFWNLEKRDEVANDLFRVRAGYEF